MQRAMSMVEIMVVAAIAAVLAGGAMASMSAIAKRQVVSQTLEQVLNDVQQQRVAHVAAGREELLAFCIDCIDADGNAKVPEQDNVLNAYLIDDPLQPDRGRPAFIGTYDRALELDLGTRPHVAIDALGRSVTCDTRQPLAVTMSIQMSGSRESIIFGGDGRLDPSFGQETPQLAPHAQNLSSRVTPDPMPRGTFTGDATRAAALPLH
jgi:prepilin-type N-terminal cleavage/methylation domain-containing protein